MRTTVLERKDHERQFRASVASLGSGYQTNLMNFAYALCGDVEDTLAENARLQERVEEAERRAKRLNMLHNAKKAERDRYKALAERRKEGDELWRRVRALVGRVSGEQDLEVFAFLVGLMGRWNELNQGARAATRRGKEVR